MSPELPRQKVETLTGQVGTEHLKIVDFRHVLTPGKFIALMQNGTSSTSR